jgi:hypothetical protein
MSDTCPECGVDVTQSSGVVCPECGFVLQPELDSAPLLTEQKSRHKGLGRLLCFVVPAGFVAVWGVASGANLSGAALSGAVMGALFFVAWSLAGRVANNPFGQVLMGIVFFFGGTAVVVGV